MSEVHVVPVPDAARDRCFINDDQYQALYERSINDPEGFWAEQADIFVDWFEKWTEISDAAYGLLREYSAYVGEVVDAPSEDEEEKEQ